MTWNGTGSHTRGRLGKKVGMGVRHCCRRPDCDKCFKTHEAMAGHMGGAHRAPRPLKSCLHGTMAGYKCEIRRGEETCEACRRMWRNTLRLRRYEKMGQRHDPVDELWFQDGKWIPVADSNLPEAPVE